MHWGPEQLQLYWHIMQTADWLSPCILLLKVTMLEESTSNPQPVDVFATLPLHPSCHVLTPLQPWSKLCSWCYWNETLHWVCGEKLRGLRYLLPKCRWDVDTWFLPLNIMPYTTGLDQGEQLYLKNHTMYKHWTYTIVSLDLHIPLISES